MQEGKETLPRCDLCGMHMPAGRLTKHHRTRRCDKNRQMWWRRREAAIARRCTEASFILTVEEEAEYIEGVDTFKYLGRMLDWSDNNWTAVFRNVRKVRQVWKCLGKLLWREGADS